MSIYIYWYNYLKSSYNKTPNIPYTIKTERSDPSPWQWLLAS